MNYYNDDTLVQSEVRIINRLPKIGIDNAQQEILDGLMSDPKYLSPKFFYDKRGSLLFEKITHLKEYYPSRTEKHILKNLLNHVDIDFSDADVVELGSGDSSKISLLLDQVDPNILSTTNYFPLDISISAIKKSIHELNKRYHLKSITGIVSDFFHSIDIPNSNRKRIYCFFGSTLGNFSPIERKDFLMMLSSSMRKGDQLLLGVDMVKDVNILEDAYNDKLGVTSDFNKNVMNVVNHIIGSNIDIDNFSHHAFFNAELSRIEMHLRANHDISIELVKGVKPIFIEKGETIHTENSYKFSPERIAQISKYSGLYIVKQISNLEAWFNVILFTKL